MDKQDSASAAPAKKTSVPTWLAPTALAIGFILLGYWAISVYPGWVAIGKWMDKTDSPAWVQAVGSILAIAFSAVFVVVQHRLELKRQKSADFEIRARKLGIVVQLAKSMATATSLIAGGVGTQDDHTKKVEANELISPEFLKFHDVLAAVPLYELDSAAVLAEVIVLQKNCAAFSRIFEAISANPRKLDPAEFTEGRKNLLLISTVCTTCHTTLKECLDTLRKENSQTGS